MDCPSALLHRNSPSTNPDHHRQSAIFCGLLIDVNLTPYLYVKLPKSGSSSLYSSVVDLTPSSVPLQDGYGAPALVVSLGVIQKLQNASHPPDHQLAALRAALPEAASSGTDTSRQEWANVSTQLYPKMRCRQDRAQACPNLNGLPSCLAFP